MKIQKNLIGDAGEHLVLSRLLRLGVLASQVTFHAKKYDILANPTKKNNPVLIQVKTTSLKGSAWKIELKDAENPNSNFYFCFVDLSCEPEKIYIIPSKKVYQVLSEAHRAQMAKPKKDGSKRTKHQFPKLKNYFINDIKSAPDGWMDKYLNNWDVFTK